MKRSFTLIELLVTLFLSAMVLVFVIGVQSNFSREMNNLQTKQFLAQESVVMMMLLKEGFMMDEMYCPGIATAQNYKNNNISYKDWYGYTIEVTIEDEKLKIYRTKGSSEKTYFIDNLKYSNFSLEPLDQPDENATLLRIRFDVEKPHSTFDVLTDTPKYINYSKMVYIK